MIDTGKVQVICKMCGKSAPASEFTLDPYYMKVVCAACAKARKANEKNMPIVEKKVQSEPMPEKRPNVNTIDLSADPNRIKHTCHKCKYKFIYNKEKHYPNLCPHCGAHILDM